MPAPTITALPETPLRSDAADNDTFNAKVETFLTALEGFDDEVNAFGTYLNNYSHNITAGLGIEVSAGEVAIKGGDSEQTGTAYTLALTDAFTLLRMNNAAANTVTVPPNATVAFPVGTRIDIAQYGAGATTIAAGSGVTIRSKDSALTLNGQYVGATLQKIDTDEWMAFGDLTA